MHVGQGKNSRFDPFKRRQVNYESDTAGAYTLTLSAGAGINIFGSPFTLSVIADVADATGSYAAGTAFTSAVAGQETFFYVYAGDRFGNPVTAAELAFTVSQEFPDATGADGDCASRGPYRQAELTVVEGAACSAEAENPCELTYEALMVTRPPSHPPKICDPDIKICDQTAS